MALAQDVWYVPEDEDTDTSIVRTSYRWIGACPLGCSGANFNSRKKGFWTFNGEEACVKMMINHIYSSSNHKGVAQTWQGAKTIVMEFLDKNSDALEVQDESWEDREAYRQEYAPVGTAQPQQMEDTAEDDAEHEDEAGVDDAEPRMARARAAMAMPRARAKTPMPMPPKAPPPSHLAPKSQQATKMEDLRTKKKEQDNLCKSIQMAVAKGMADSLAGSLSSIPQKRALPSCSSSSERNVRQRIVLPDVSEVVNLLNQEETTTVPLRLLHEMQQSMRRVISSCEQAARVSNGVKVVVEGFSNQFLAERQNADELLAQLENAMRRIPQ
jgi:hypothetical protein